MRDLQWQCKRCRRLGNDGCDMPDYTVPVPYEDGIRFERPACPLELVEAPTGLWRRLRNLFLNARSIA